MIGGGQEGKTEILVKRRKVAAMELMWVIVIVIVCGAAGGFVNVFIGDSGLHLPRVENDILQPGFLGTVLVGALAALGSWGAAKAIVIFGATTPALNFSTVDITNALLIGFGGAKWFKSETEKDVLQKTAAIAAGKNSDQSAAITIASGTPNQALKAAMQMQA
jgi:carbon starvation protein CstA